MMNGELSVGHSFVRGGDYPSVEMSQIGLLGADLKINKATGKSIEYILQRAGIQD